MYYFTFSLILFLLFGGAIFIQIEPWLLTFGIVAEKNAAAVLAIIVAVFAFVLTSQISGQKKNWNWKTLIGVYLLGTIVAVISGMNFVLSLPADLERGVSAGGLFMAALFSLIPGHEAFVKGRKTI